MDKERCISAESLETTGFHYTLSLINGKYKMTVLYTLMEFGVVRFNEMKRYIGNISYKTLSTTLKELEWKPTSSCTAKNIHRSRRKSNILSRNAVAPLSPFSTVCANGATNTACNDNAPAAKRFVSQQGRIFYTNQRPARISRASSVSGMRSLWSAKARSNLRFSAAKCCRPKRMRAR